MASNKFYYVSCIEGDRYSLLVGPLKTKRQALALVDEAKEIAKRVDRRAVFYAFGTCSSKNNQGDGVLNHLVLKGGS